LSAVDVLVPVLGRPNRAAPLLASLRASERDVRLRAVLICSAGDVDEIAACEAAEPDELLVAPWKPGSGDYARKVNWAAERSSSPWLFLGADDLAFHPGWAETAIRQGEATPARVVGTNDLGNPHVRRGIHSTHSLVARSYLEVGLADGRPGLLYEGYDHQYVDNELVETAKWRREWAFAAGAVVEHLHPHWGKAETDATYEKALSRTPDDRALFFRRRRLWRRTRPRVRRARAG
jgi:hypothetical protein